MEQSEPSPPNPAALANLEAQSRALNLALKDARAARDAAQASLASARESLTALTLQLDADRRALDRVMRQRSELPDAESLAVATRAAERHWGARVAARDALQRDYDSSGGASLALDLEQARRAAAHLREQLQRTVDERNQLTGTLHGATGAALHETVQDLEAELAEAQARLTRLQRDAAAARRLYEVLRAEFQSARERLTQPVIERIRPYLGDLFPASEVWLDEALTLRGLRSANVDEAFAELSGGAREQLSLLVRIGLAEVLRHEEPWPLVLDDVLVNTDAARIQRMQRVLYHAGRQMQILLFTCHGPLFDTLGPDVWVQLPPSLR